MQNTNTIIKKKQLKNHTACKNILSHLALLINKAAPINKSIQAQANMNPIITLKPVR